MRSALNINISLAIATLSIVLSSVALSSIATHAFSHTLQAPAVTTVTAADTAPKATTTIAATSLNKQLVIAAVDYPPFSIPEGEGRGAILDIIRAALALENIDTQFNFVSMARSKLLTQSGEMFGVAPLLKTQARSRDYDFSVPLTRSIQRFYFNTLQFPDGFEWQTFEDFTGYRMGAVDHYWYEEDFVQAKLDMHHVACVDQNFFKLATQRVDFILDAELHAQISLQTLSEQQRQVIASASKPESDSQIYIMLSRHFPNSQYYRAKLKSGLNKLVASGEYQNILARYGFPANYALY